MNYCLCFAERKEKRIGVFKFRFNYWTAALHKIMTHKHYTGWTAVLHRMDCSTTQDGLQHYTGWTAALHKMVSSLHELYYNIAVVHDCK